MEGRKLLIVGATGKQGGAVIAALQASQAKFEILALTRNPSSPGAQALARKANVTLVKGDPTKPTPIFKAHKGIYGVFSVTLMGKEDTEEAQAYSLIDEAIENNVEHFVFSSVDRGGPGESEENPTPVPHFATKYRIEKYLKDQIAMKRSNMAWTILRPVAFMDNLTPDFNGKGFASMWAGVGDKPLQLISCHDIGVFGVRAFLNPTVYKGTAISLAGDDLNLAQARKVFRDTLGYRMPETFAFFGKAIKSMVKEMGIMFGWFKDVGYGADIPVLRKQEPRLQDFGAWLKESSGFKPQNQGCKFSARG